MSRDIVPQPCVTRPCVMCLNEGGRENPSWYNVWYVGTVDKPEPLCYVHALAQFAGHQVLALRHINSGSDPMGDKEHQRIAISFVGPEGLCGYDLCSCGGYWGHS